MVAAVGVALVVSGADVVSSLPPPQPVSAAGNASSTVVSARMIRPCSVFIWFFLHRTVSRSSASLSIVNFIVAGKWRLDETLARFIMYRLFFQSGEHQGRRVAIRQGPVLLGRHPDCTIRLPDPGVALQHAMLEDQPNGGVRLRRLATDVVLRVNQRDVTEAELQHGDAIEIGPHHFEFQHGSVTTIAGPTKRRLGLLQQLTLMAVGVLLLGQMAFLFTISIWRRGQPPAATNSSGVTTNITRIAAAPTKLPSPPIKTQLPPPVARVSNAPVESAALSNEIQQMQKEIVQLHQDVAALPAPTPVVALPALPTTNVVNATDETDDLVLAQAQRMFKKTMSHAAQLEAETLDSELETIENMAPDFLPPYVERAQALERRGLSKDALTQWQRVQKLAKNSDLRLRAEEEIARLETRPSTPRTPELVVVPPVTPKPAPRVSATRPVVCLAQVERQKLMATEKYDELRLLRITIAPVTGVALFNPSEVEVVVNFFDRDEKSGRVALSRAIVPGAALRAAATALMGAPVEFTASYQVPRGLRQQEERQSGGAWRYYGYRVELLYQGKLHDQREHPAGLPSAD
ncbi:MAG: FHA domain-containing protein [Verrucomicrobia bacterium]|nr:MAG: FHA domain-containing protein [Verrucomicrobiota bacterium]